MSAFRALCWIRWRELTGSHAKVVASLIVAWCALVSTSAFVSVRFVAEAGPDLLAASGTAVWLALAVAPLVGAGGAEIASRGRLTPWPVPLRSLYAATWAATLTDVPALAVAPLAIGVAAGANGVPGALAALGLIAAASATGQAAAWSATMLLRGRRRWLVAGIVFAAIAGCVVAASRGASNSVWLPGGWLSWAAHAGGLGWLVLFVALLAITVLAGAGGWKAFSTVVVRDDNGSIGATRGRQARDLPTSPLGALALVFLRSTLRAATTRFVFAGAVVAALGAGLLGTVPTDRVSVTIAVAFAATAQVNVFSYHGSGMTIVACSPLEPAQWLRAHMFVTAGCSFVLVTAATAVSAVAGAELTLETLPTIVGFVAGLSGLGIWFSTQFAHPVDQDSLRSQPTTLRASVGFIVLTFGMIALLDVASFAYSGAVGVCGVAVGYLLYRRAVVRCTEGVEQLLRSGAG